MRLNPDPTDSKFKGWVVEYANDPAYKGTNAYLLVRDWARPQLPESATHTYSIGTCTIFDSREAADQWAKTFPNLLGEKGHLLPEVRPVWSINTLTLENPNRDERVKELGESIVNGLKSLKGLKT